MGMTDEQIVEIRRLCAQTEPKLTQAEIGRRFGISQAAVSKIRRGGTRPNLPGVDVEDGRGKLTAAQRAEVLALLGAGVAQREIADRYGVTQSAVALIKLRAERRATSRGM